MKYCDVMSEVPQLDEVAEEVIVNSDSYDSIGDPPTDRNKTIVETKLSMQDEYLFETHFLDTRAEVASIVGDALSDSICDLADLLPSNDNIASCTRSSGRIEDVTHSRQLLDDSGVNINTPDGDRDDSRDAFSSDRCNNTKKHASASASICNFDLKFSKLHLYSPASGEDVDICRTIPQNISEVVDSNILNIEKGKVINGDFSLHTVLDDDKDSDVDNNEDCLYMKGPRRIYLEPTHNAGDDIEQRPDFMFRNGMRSNDSKAIGDDDGDGLETGQIEDDIRGEDQQETAEDEGDEALESGQSEDDDEDQLKDEGDDAQEKGQTDDDDEDQLENSLTTDQGRNLAPMPPDPWHPIFALRSREMGYSSRLPAAMNFCNRTGSSIRLAERFELHAHLERHTQSVNALHFNRAGYLLLGFYFYLLIELVAMIIQQYYT